MGSKADPGRFDCYAKAEPEEPLFTLLARDPLADGLVDLWGAIARGDADLAQLILGELLDAKPTHLDRDKILEAHACARAMRRYRRTRARDLPQDAEIVIDLQASALSHFLRYGHCAPEDLTRRFGFPREIIETYGTDAVAVARRQYDRRQPERETAA